MEEEGVGRCSSSSSSVSEGEKKENCSDMVFLIVIECGENSYSISKKGIDQSQQIALSRLEWVELIKLCDPVTSYMRRRDPAVQEGGGNIVVTCHREFIWGRDVDNSVNQNPFILR